MKVVMKKIIIALLIVACTSVSAGAQINMTEVDPAEEVRYQLGLYREVTEYVDDTFQKFSEGYINPATALKKVNLLNHEYNKLAEPLPEETKRLHQLIKILLSRIENYFIYYGKAFRENPEINMKIAETKFELSREAQRLEFLYAR